MIDINWFGIIKTIGYRGLDPQNECCRKIRAHIRKDDKAINLGIPNMIETMECEELSIFLDGISIGKSVEIPDGRVITFRDDTTALIHMGDIVEIFRECIEGKQKIQHIPGEDMTDETWRLKYT